MNAASAGAVGAIRAVTDPSELAKYQMDESSTFRGSADSLYLPRDEAELAGVLKELCARGIFFTFSGGGTGITGSRCPVHGGAVISTERMTRPQAPCPGGYEEVREMGSVIYLDAAGLCAVVPAAMRLSDLDLVLAARGLLYPPDPTEMTATLGGTIATNASGARSFHYGPTRFWVEGFSLALPDGEILTLGRGGCVRKGDRLEFPTKGGGRRIIPMPPPESYPMPDIKNAAGLYIRPGMDAVDLFIGAEGLLGCFTDATVRLIRRPSRTLSVVAYFGSDEDALNFVDAAVRKIIQVEFLSLEYFDRGALDFMRGKYPDIPGAAAAVLFETGYGRDAEAAMYPSGEFLRKIEACLAAHRSCGNWSIGFNGREAVRLFRHSLPEAVNDYVRKRCGKIGTDLAVPHGRMREMMAAYREEAGEAKVPYVMFGHIGNDHLHLNFLPDDAESAARAKRAYGRLAAKAVALGGTISAEHGVGKKTISMDGGKAVPYLELMYGKDGLAAIAGIKRALDPLGLANPGNIIPAQKAG